MTIQGKKYGGKKMRLNQFKALGGGNDDEDNDDEDNDADEDGSNEEDEF